MKCLVCRWQWRRPRCNHIMILEDGGKLMTTCRSGACGHGQLYPLTIDNVSLGETRGDTLSFTAGLNTRLEGRQRDSSSSQLISYTHLRRKAFVLHSTVIHTQESPARSSMHGRLSQTRQ